MASNILTAIAKSIWEPSFFKFAGAKFIVTLPGGIEYPLFEIADFTLSFDSFIDKSGSPTILKAWSPLDKSASTSIS